MISLTGLKIFKSMSQETTAFTAQIVRDGQIIGQVRNDGQGGEDVVTPPRIRAEITDDMISTAFGDAVNVAEMKKLMRNRVLFRDSNGAVLQTKTLTPALLVAATEHYTKKGCVVLNTLPLTEAALIYLNGLGSK